MQNAVAAVRFETLEAVAAGDRLTTTITSAVGVAASALIAAHQTPPGMKEPAPPKQCGSK